MRGRLRIGGWSGALILLAVAGSLTGPTAAFGHGKVICKGETGRGVFDPIVKPRLYGVENGLHGHTFLTNHRIDNEGYRQFSTFDGPKSIVGAANNCDQDDDSAAYWFPSLYRYNGEFINVRRFTAYYYPGSRGSQRHVRTNVETYPDDLRLVAGRRDESGTEFVNWDCGDNSIRDGRYATPAEARCDLANDDLRLKVWFPDCWDGQKNPHMAPLGVSTADFSDDGSVVNHLAYSDFETVQCPASHPRKLPSLHLTIVFDYRLSGAGVTVSNGDFGQMHADFWNTWIQNGQDPRAQFGGLQSFVNTCIDDVAVYDGIGPHHGHNGRCGASDGTND